MAGFEVIIYGRFWVITEDHVMLDMHRAPRDRMSINLHQTSWKSS